MLWGEGRVKGDMNETALGWGGAGEGEREK